MDHDTARTKVCILCFKKGSYKILGKEHNIKAIRGLIAEYDTDDRGLPTSICSSCTTAVYNLEKKEKDYNSSV